MKCAEIVCSSPTTFRLGFLWLNRGKVRKRNRCVMAPIVRGFAESSACRYSRSVITGIDAWVSTTTAGAARMKQCERLTQIVWNGSFRRI